MRQFGAHEMCIAFVVGVHGNRGVAEHRLQPGRGHHDVRLRVVEGTVPEADQLALDVGVGHLDVADRGLQHRRPVDQALGLVDEAVVEHLLEHGVHRARESLVHGEAFARPVDAVTQAAHLFTDVAGDLGLLLPHAFDERLTAQVVAGLALGGQLAFDHRLHGDRGVVHTGQPQHFVALHAFAPGQRIHQHMLVGVPHVQRTVDVRRRDDDRERRFVARRVGGEVPRVYPALIQPGFVFGGVPRLRQCGRVGALCFTIAHPTILGNPRTRQGAGRHPTDHPRLRLRSVPGSGTDRTVEHAGQETRRSCRSSGALTFVSHSGSETGTRRVSRASVTASIRRSPPATRSATTCADNVR